MRPAGAREMRREPPRAPAVNLGRRPGLRRVTLALAIACVTLAALDVVQFVGHL